MHILVTGGAGFIGSHLVDRLLADGHSVVSLDDLSNGLIWHHEHHLNNPRFRFVEGDINKTSLLHPLFAEEKFDAVMHMAANSDISAGEDPTIDTTRTFNTALSVLEAMRIHGVRQIIFASTSAVYGNTPGNLNELSSPLQPISNYGASKLAAEGFISVYAHTHGIQSWVLRFANVCGPRSTHGVFYNFVPRLAKNSEWLEIAFDGEQGKPYNYVTDLVEAIMLVWQKGEAAPLGVYMVGSDEAVSVNKIVDDLSTAMGIENLERRYTGKPSFAGDVRALTYDDSKLRALGYSPKMTSREAVAETAKQLVEAYKHRPW